MGQPLDCARAPARNSRGTWAGAPQQSPSYDASLPLPVNRRQSSRSKGNEYESTRNKNQIGATKNDAHKAYRPNPAARRSAGHRETEGYSGSGRSIADRL